MKNRTLYALALIVMLLVTGTAALVWWLQRPQDIGQGFGVLSQDGRYVACGITFTRMRILGGDEFYCRLVVIEHVKSDQEGYSREEVIHRSVVPVPIKHIEVSELVFEEAGAIQWDPDGETVRFYIHDKEVLNWKIPQKA